MGLILLLLAGAGLALPGCSKQGEGERCSPAANGSEDCDEGLVCTTPDKAATDFGRCCPPQGAEPSDSRCNFTSNPVGTGGSSSSGGSSSGGSSTGGSSTGGTPSAEGGTGATSNGGAGGSDDPAATGGAAGAEG
jgi:hypothetical protein